jgi:hypothetical protein
MEVAKTTGATVRKVMTGASEAAPQVITKTRTVVKTQVIEKEKKAAEKPQITVEILRGGQQTQKSFTIEQE